MQSRVILVAAFLALAGCTTTQDANKVLASRYIGASADEFFVQNGPPAAEHVMDDGRKMYLWAERPQSLNIGGSSFGTVNVVGNTAWWNGWSSPSQSVTIQCSVRIVTRAGKIEAILSHQDTVGWWQLSRCSEVFKKA